MAFHNLKAVQPRHTLNTISGTISAEDIL